ncbi:MAG: VWA domain-containing protein [Gammaproteobacteria bacterium]|nr:VWA domain-containing protein [Gammaproteobacteria bacterium]
MSVNLDDYREALEKAAPQLKDTLDATFHEAARNMSAQALHDYMEGARGLANLGRGPNLVTSFLEEMPAVAKECGDDIIRDCISAAMKLSSMTSGEVIALMFASLPNVSRRLGDPEMVRAYLQLIHQLSAKASRGLRPMLGVMDELLSKLTLSGLKRWALYGAQAYAKDLPGQARFFALETEDSKAMLQQQRRGSLFIDNQRKMNFYLRALWGRDFFLRPTAADHDGFKPYIQARIMHLPDAVDPIGDVSGQDLYRAMVVHQAAHLMYTREPISAEQLSPAQIFFIGFMEDARIEYCAMQNFPGLKKLWGSLHRIERKDKPLHPTVLVLERVALSLLDAEEKVGDAEIDALVEKFRTNVESNKDNPQFSWHMGLELFNLLTARKDVPSLRILESLRIPYRDDNRLIWDFDEFAWADSEEYMAASQRQVRKYVSAVEMANEVDCELAGDDAQEVWICATEFMPYEDDLETTVSFNQMWGKEPVSDPFHYQEWDYQVQLHRPDWATVFERRQPKADPQIIDNILIEHKPVTHRIKKIIDMLQPEGVQRVRNLEDGDEIDINAAIDAMISIRMGEQPNPRITMRNVIKNRDLSVVVLLDLSESTNEKMNGSEKTVLELTREAASLVATAINGVGDPFAIHGFASDGRHDVQYYRFKDFAEKWGDDVKSRLAGMKGGYSTRMGAALRHAGRHLLEQRERKKLILVVTDGEPADIDERDPQHLRMDTKKAVEELSTKGVMTYCLTLDPDADAYVKRIFGANSYTVIDHVDRLPEKLPSLFASLTR